MQSVRRRRCDRPLPRLPTPSGCHPGRADSRRLGRLHKAGVPAGRIFRARDMFTDPHFATIEEAIARFAAP